MHAHMVHGPSCAVASGHPLATEEALRVLAEGGNAVDAAIAAGMVLNVVCPYATTLAGDMFIMVHKPGWRTPKALNGTGTAPRLADSEFFSGQIPRDGILSVTIPGLLAGFDDSLRRWGTRDLSSLCGEAIRIAEEGFAISPYFVANTRQRAALIGKDPEASRLFLPQGAPAPAGSLLAQPELAACLRDIVDHGIETFYTGALGERLAEGMRQLGGLVRGEDLAAHATLIQEPVIGPFAGHEVATMPPNSYGATLLLQLLHLESSGVGALDPDSAAFALLGLQARRLAYRIAGPLIGDPESLEAPLRALLEERFALGHLETRAPMPPEAGDRCTTNVIVIDREGMAVSMVQSISAPYGAGVVIPGTGILLNNRLAGFSADPASANCVAPGKRPAHTLAPAMVLKQGQLAMSLGTPGTVGQTCVLAQFLARVLACGQSIDRACDAPRWSVDFTGKPVLEDHAPDTLRQAFFEREPEARTMPAGWISFGSIKLAMPEGTGLTAMADGRRIARAGAA